MVDSSVIYWLLDDCIGLRKGVFVSASEGSLWWWAPELPEELLPFLSGALYSQLQQAAPCRGNIDTGVKKVISFMHIYIFAGCHYSYLCATHEQGWKYFWIVWKMWLLKWMDDSCLYFVFTNQCGNPYSIAIYIKCKGHTVVHKLTSENEIEPAQQKKVVLLCGKLNCHVFC